MDWKFDKNIAKIFTNHARKHIPNYDQVIDLSIEICDRYQKSSKIVDIGCATGETIRRLHENDFINLYGIDNSPDMLDECPDYATYIISSNYPESLKNIDVAIMNWTLHFIEDKISYLKSIYENMSTNGTLILSEKVSLNPIAIGYYHKFKKSQGVSEQEIKIKEEQIQNIMFINDVKWYLDTLTDIGFKNIHIVNSHWCFNTFVCFK